MKTLTKVEPDGSTNLPSGVVQPVLHRHASTLQLDGRMPASGQAAFSQPPKAAMEASLNSGARPGQSGNPPRKAPESVSSAVQTQQATAIAPSVPGAFSDHSPTNVPGAV